MGLKKDTLLRWVNCCSDASTTIERITNLADGWFFIHILNFLRSHPTDGRPTDPWLQTINILREYKLQENVVDFDAAASGNEDELAKLIVIIMHLTMVQKPCEHIKERTMWKLSTEDQKVIEAILLDIINDDQITRNRLIDVLQDNFKESSFTKSSMFGVSSSLSSLSSKRNSPLRLFLDSPMELRLTRLRKEISDKNEEIRRLQSELMTESDESFALSLRMDDLKRKLKDLEKKNTELEQRLRDVQLPESSSPDTDVEIIHLKMKLKKMQNEYETSCQKYCDLNIEYDAMKTQQEKDRKQIRQLQLDLNDTVARFEKESAEYQLLLDSSRTENAELKQSLEEKALWIDVLEEKSRTCSEMHANARLNAPRFPCENESIGYSLLSIETEKLHCDLESYRRDLIRQSNQFNSEKSIFQQRTAALEEDKRNLCRQIEDANLKNQSLQVKLDQTEKSLKQIMRNSESFSKEREELHHSLDELKSKFDNEMTHAQQQFDIHTQKSLEFVLYIDELNQQLKETQSAKKALEQYIHEVNEQKLGLGQSMTALEQRGSAACNVGTLADAMIDARRRSMRPARSEVASTSKERQETIEVFRPPQLAFSDDSEDVSSILKVSPSRRDSTSSVCSNRSDICITSRGTNVPHGAGRLFTCDDEDGELFSSSYLNEMKEGKCRVEDSSTRVSELLRRNAMQPPHMRSAYPIEMNDERLRQNDMTIYDQPKANSSSSWNPTDKMTPVMQPRKRRSYELDADLSSDFTGANSFLSCVVRKRHQDASLTLETKSIPSISSSPSKSTSKGSSKAGSKRTSPVHGAKNSNLTPVGSLLRKVQAKFRRNIETSIDFLAEHT